jgi:ubiquitin carboxyl-terminal hydrolase 8
MDTKSIFYKKGLCGITNLGNTCFMNSIIQCINANRELAEYFLNNEHNKFNMKEQSEKNLVDEWILLSNGLYDKNAVITPESFHRTIQLLSIKKGNGCFTGYDQNDSQEFLQFFLENLHIGLSREVNMNINGKPKNILDKMAIKALTNWKQFFKDDYSIIIQLYYGQLYSKITTKEDTTFLSESYDPISNISLEIPDGDNLTIYDCFDKFSSEESIDFKNSESDTKKYNKKLAVWRFPNYLIIFFKRFTNMGQKINKIIDFPINNLNLNKYCVGYDKEECIYDLYAVSNHGGGTSGGHYWAYSKNYDNDWYKFNDKYVTALEESNIVSNNAYCLFYKKID